MGKAVRDAVEGLVRGFVVRGIGDVGDEAMGG